MKSKFNAIIYKTGINPCVDVPVSITKSMTPAKGFIRVKGKINDFEFEKSLVPVKNAPYRLFVNLSMLKGGNAEVGKRAQFYLKQDKEGVEKKYTAPDLLLKQLKDKNLLHDFNTLTASRKKDIIKYLNYLKTEESLLRNIKKVIHQLLTKGKKVRVP